MEKPGEGSQFLALVIKAALLLAPPLPAPPHHPFPHPLPLLPLFFMRRL